jgi:hypothetical protein
MHFERRPLIDLRDQWVIPVGPGVQVHLPGGICVLCARSAAYGKQQHSE